MKYGVKGRVTIFTKLKHCRFDAINNFVIDPMHNIFIGVIKKLFSLWFGTDFSGYAFSIRRKLKQLDAIVLELSICKTFSFLKAEIY